MTQKTLTLPTKHNEDTPSFIQHCALFQTTNHTIHTVKHLIETERLYLRQISSEDEEGLFKLHSDPIVQKYTGEPPVTSREEIAKAIASRNEHYNTHGYGRWATLIKDGGHFVGWAGLAYLPEFDETDLGYRFLQEYWGMGLATEASRAILEYGFDILNLERIVAIAMKENTASIRVMQKVGMQFEKYAPYEEGSDDAVWYWCDQEMIRKTQNQ